MGAVYKAHDTRLDRTVAIKTLLSEKDTDPERRRRFEQEARSASALNHPNIVHIYEIGEDGDTPFIAMEFVAGKSLDQLIPARGIGATDALRIAVQIADALSAAHDAGVIHRDLKPGNVLVGEDGRVRVVDFGLAKLLETKTGGRGIAEQESTETVSGTPRTPLTEEGTILGTVAYVSPEQAEGRPVDARSDIFSFGCVLYEMLSGRKAFRGESKVSTLAAILKDDPAPLQDAGVDLPRELVRIVNRCLRKDPERRFQGMKDVKVALQEILEELDSGALPLRAERAGDGGRARSRWWMAAAAVAVVAAVAGWMWFGGMRSNNSGAPLIATPLTSYPGNEITPALSPDGGRVAFSWNGGDGKNHDIYVQVVGAGEPLRLTSDEAYDWAPSWSPDGREILFYRYWREGKFAVVSVPPLAGRERVLRESPFPPELPELFLFFLGPSWSSDGQCTAHPGEDGVWLRPAGGPMYAVADRPGMSELFPVFAPDDRSLAFVAQAEGANSELYLQQLTAQRKPQGEPVLLLSGMRYINHLSWMPDGREIIFSADDGNSAGLWRIKTSGRDKPVRMLFAGATASSPTVSRSGTRLVYEQRTEKASLWRTPAGRDVFAPAKITKSTRSDWTPTVSPDGRRIAFASDRSGRPEIWMADLDGSGPVQLSKLGQYSVLPEWSADGRQVVFQSSGYKSNDIYVVSADGASVRRLTDHDGEELQPSWSADGKWIYFASDRSGEREIWRIPAEGGTATQVTTGGGEFARTSPDGATLYFTRGEYGSLELWKMPVQGGDAQKLDVPRIYDWGFVLAGDAIYFSGPMEAGTYPIYAFHLRTNNTERVAQIGFSPFAKFSITPDGKWVLYSLQEELSSDLMVVDNFH